MDDERPDTAISRLCVSGFTPMSGVINVGVRGYYVSGGRDDPRSHGTSSGSVDLQDAYADTDQAERARRDQGSGKRRII